ncbi:MAG: hypothetical protein K0V04_35250 [Deltaproteobacteria bacterium]|nr:hypothetical protein [Deltaproteobacteria bacterium]
MPNIKVTTPLTKDQIREIVRVGCPDLDLSSLGPGLTASRTRWVAAAINTQGKTVTVMPMVRDMTTLLLLLLVMITGIGLLIYAVVVIPKQKELVTRVTALLKRELGGAR